METFLIKALQLILSLSILVIIHEFGHFIFARIFKIRVEKFYLFFDPWFALFRYKPKNSETEYGIGWLPLGGYVKISGMIDESMDKEQMAQPVQPWEFRAKPTWQRLLVMIGGVLFNIILAFIIFWMMVFKWGDSYIPMSNVKSGMEYSETAERAGFRDGDILLYADGKEIIDRGGVIDNFATHTINAKTVTVLRNGQEVNIQIPADFVQQLMRDKKGFAGYKDDVPTVVDKVQKGSEAEKMGLAKGDSLVSVNGVATPTFMEFRNELQKNKGQQISVDFYRNGVLQTVSAQLDTTAILGFNIQSYLVTDHYSFFASFPAGIKYGIRTLKGYVGQFKHIFTKEGASSLGGFGTIGNLFPAKWSWYAFWMMTAFLSVILAFMNILPIPGLDGGHVLFLLFEVISGRKPSDKFMEYTQIAGMILLIGLVLYANGMDIVRAIFK
ncbi:MAG: RIP metalloprotease RseP [Petrimonas sp.]|jgi:regulator of sigma E protease|nr:MAG: putative zinc metalloprotease [Bacteroidetes bacterium ADurb.BinA174]